MDIEKAMVSARQLYGRTGKDVGIFCKVRYGEDANLDSDEFYVELRDPHIEENVDGFVLLVNSAG